MRILGIETSCDETGIAIYDDEKGIWPISYIARLNCMPTMAAWCRSWHRVTMFVRPYR